MKQLVVDKKKANRGVIKYLYANSNIAAIHVHVQVMQCINVRTADPVYMQREFSLLTVVTY